MSALHLYVRADELEFDPVAGDERTFGDAVEWRIPTPNGSPVRCSARLDPVAKAVVLRVGEARRAGLVVPLQSLLTAWFTEAGYVRDPRPCDQPDYTAAFTS